MPFSTSPRLHRAAALGAVIAVALATSACRVDVSVGIDADAAGGGEVRATARLDGAAVSQLGGADPADRIRLDDLREAGWAVEGPTEQDDGGLEIVATHRYRTESELAALVADLGGDPGPLRNVRMRQQRTFLTTKTAFSGTVDLRAGLGAFTDPALQQALGATPEEPLGVAPEALERRLGAAIDRLFGLQVAVRLPGDLESNAPTESDGGAVWAPALGEEVTLEATSERWNVRNIVLAAIAAGSGAALAGTSIARRRRAADLTVTPGNLTVGPHGQTGTDRGGAPSP